MKREVNKIITNKAITWMIATGLLATFGGAVSAQRGRQSGSLSALDKDYLKASAQSNLEEVQFESVVLTHAANGQDKEFGKRMRQDHARANAELKAVAARTGFQPPKDVSEDQKHIMERLAQFHGAAFDAAYKQEMVRDHTGDIAETQREMSLGKNPQVIALAQKNLALLRMHLKMSQALPSGSEKTAAGT